MMKNTLLPSKNYIKNHKIIYYFPYFCEFSVIITNCPHPVVYLFICLLFIYFLFIYLLSSAWETYEKCIAVAEMTCGPDVVASLPQLTVALSPIFADLCDTPECDYTNIGSQCVLEFSNHTYFAQQVQAQISGCTPVWRPPSPPRMPRIDISLDWLYVSFPDLERPDPDDSDRSCIPRMTDMKDNKAKRKRRSAKKDSHKSSKGSGKSGKGSGKSGSSKGSGGSGSRSHRWIDLDFDWHFGKRYGYDMGGRRVGMGGSVEVEVGGGGFPGPIIPGPLPTESCEVTFQWGILCR